MKQWDGVREGGGGGGIGSGLEPSDTCWDVFDEIIPCAKAFRCGRFGWCRGSGKTVVFRFRKSRVGGGGGWREKCG